MNKKRLIWKLFLTLLVINASRAIADEPGAFTNSLGLKFVTVSGLTNVMFCTWLTRVEDFQKFVADTNNNGGYNPRSGGSPTVLTSGELHAANWGQDWSNPGFEQRDDCPVVCVSWHEARAFCNWLTKKERAAGKIAEVQRYRLPTDAEWSIAVGLGLEAGKTPADKSMNIHDYAWGTNWPPPPGAGNFGGEEARVKGWPDYQPVMTNDNDGFPHTSPVGSFAADRPGLFDMNGNAGEWCGDVYEDAPQLRVWRGGTWNCIFPGNLWLSTRGFDLIYSRQNNVGFRMVLSPVP